MQLRRKADLSSTTCNACALKLGDIQTKIMAAMIAIASNKVSDAAKTHPAVTRRCRIRGLVKHAGNFAKGVLIGAMLVIWAWLLLG